MISFSDFLSLLLGKLASDEFHGGLGYLEYMNTPANVRAGDEADVVDARVARALLEALGYADSDWVYNRSKDEFNRPDYVVRVDGYPRPPFVLEDKNTTVDSLADNFPQLARYMRAVGATRGLLCNGKELLGYESGFSGVQITSRLSLYNLVLAWRGEGIYTGTSGPEALSAKDKASLFSLYSRFSKDSFTGIPRLVEELIYTDETPARLHYSDASAPDDPTRNSWPAHARIEVIGTSEPGFLDKFIDETRAVLAEIEQDVEAQLDAQLIEHNEFQERIQLTPGGKDAIEEYSQLVSRLLEVLGAFRPHLGEGYLSAVRLRLEGMLDHFGGRHSLDALGEDIMAEMNRVAGAAAEDFEAEGAKRRKGGVQPSLIGGQEPEGPRRGPTRRVRRHLPEPVTTILGQLLTFLSELHGYRAELEERFARSNAAGDAFDSWRAKVGLLLYRDLDEDALRREFAIQTSYVLFVRLLLVRVAEDKRLLDRLFTNGGLSVWFSEVEPRYLKFARAKSTSFLLELAYSSAQHIYGHFYHAQDFYDWYLPERALVVRLLHRLAHYDFSDIDHDVIGHLYGRYVFDQHKHESGLYYTPPPVVDHILDAVSFSGTDVVGQTLLDPACGAGTFLVQAARRIIDAYRAHHGGTIPPDQVSIVLETVVNSLYGLDVNPFACYLAETNLLIQVMDLIKEALDAGSDVHVDRFNIFNTDTLRFDTKTLVRLGGAYTAGSLPEAEEIKARVGNFADGFNVVVGNPPYVRADEGAAGLGSYRSAIKNEYPFEEVAGVLVKRWDLFVPFVAIGLRLLRDGGRMSMITSRSIEGAEYAKPLRDALAEQQIDSIDFFEGNVRLFEDAEVVNTIFALTRKAPADDHEVRRSWHSGMPPATTNTEPLLQQEFGPEVFNQRATSAGVAFPNAVPLGKICYLSYGMRLNAADEVPDSDRFVKADLVSGRKTPQFPVPFVENEDLAAYELVSLKYLEYGPGLRAPARIYRKTFPELYDREKLLLPKVISQEAPQQVTAWLDTNSLDDGWVYTYDGVIVAVPWHSLHRIRNRSIGSRDRSDLEALSRDFLLPYIAAVVNSRYASELVRNNRRDPSNIFPQVYQKLPIPRCEMDKQKKIEAAVLLLQQWGLEFLAFRIDGWTIDVESETVRAPRRVPSGTKLLSLAHAKVRWQLKVELGELSLDGAQRRGRQIVRGQRVIGEIDPSQDARSLDWLLGQLQDANETLASAEANGLDVPATPKDAVAALDAVESNEARVLRTLRRFTRLRRGLDAVIAQLYEEARAVPASVV